VILHDPQTAGLTPALREHQIGTAWRCHVGVDVPTAEARAAWSFLKPYVQAADAYVFSREGFVWDGLDPAKRAIIAPSIDVFAPKNAELSSGAVDAILTGAGLRAGSTPGRALRSATLLETRPLASGERFVLQVSRWDSLKDPIGVIEGFAEHVAPYSDAHLIYAAPDVTAVSDDPEGAEVHAQACERWHSLAPAARERVHLALLPMEDAEENAAIVNALQRAVDSVAEASALKGFGLTVAEAMWKARPVVASALGGIQDQIEHERSGLLLADPRDPVTYGAAVVRLLGDRDEADALGRAARERVRHHFLSDRSLVDYLTLLAPLLTA